jgi:hypothetical protein
MKTTKLRRTASLLLALVLALPLLPTAAFGASPESVTAYVTISTAGTIPVGGGTLMARAPVTATDLNANGTIDIDDALAAAHARYADASRGYASAAGTYGLAITKLWGDTSGAFGYYVNDASASGLTDAVNDGDAITAYVFSDQSSWSDTYTYFDVSSVTAAKDAAFDLTLTAAGWTSSSPLSGAQIVTIDPATGAGTNVEGKTTDSNGQVSLSFAAAGTYYVSAASAAAIVPPVCVVTVKDTLSDADYVSAAAARLTWNGIRGSNAAQNSVTSSPDIPSSVTVNGQSVAVSWACSDTTGALSVSNYYGPWSAYVDRPKSADAEAALTATLTYGTAEAEKTFGITVKAEGATESRSVVAYGPLMQGIAKNYADSDASTSAINDSDIPWAAADMAKYGSTLGEAARYAALKETGTNAALAKYILAEIAQGRSASAPDAAGANIWSAPSILLARRAAGKTSYADNEALITAMLDYLNGPQSAFDTDTVSAMLPALAAYCGSASVKTAADAAVAWLSSHQNSDGTWSSYGTSSCESTAAVVTALASLGIDAHTDQRFIKNGKSAIEGLMSFALADNSGFGHKGNVTYNAMATEQGFRALVAYARFKAAGSAYNIYADAASGTAPAPAISATYVPGDTGGTAESKSVTVTVSVYGDTVHGSSAPHIFSSDGGSGRAWITSQSETFSNGGTAMDAVKKALSDNGYKVSATSYYISAVTTPAGAVLSEKSNGDNSGWLCLVNGASLSVGMNDYALAAGDKVTFYYTDDYTKESGSEKWSGTPPASASAGSVSLSDAAAYIYRTVPAPTFGAVGGEWAVTGVARSGFSAPESWYASYFSALSAAVSANKGVLSERKYTEYARAVLALTAIGRDPKNVAGYDLLAPLGDYDAVMKQGVNGAVWALIALDSGNYEVPQISGGSTQATRDMYIKAILSSELAGGGFSVSGTGAADPDMTAMALTALSRHADYSGASAVINRGLAKLAAMQNSSGGFDGGYSESVSQAIVALSSLGIGMDDARFVKNGKTLLDALGSYAAVGGGFRHALGDSTANAMASEQALCALDAAARLAAKKNAVYDMTDAKSSAGYADVRSGDWFSSAADYCAGKGVMTGVSEGRFAPYMSTSRAMMAASLYRLAGAPTIYYIRRPDSAFSDVADGAWYYNAVMWDSLNGITRGAGGGRFAPDDAVTREQAAVMLYRWANYKGLDTTQGGMAIREYRDFESVSAYALEAMTWAVNTGILGGRSGLLAPDAAAPRAETAQMLMRLCEYYKL